MKKIELEDLLSITDNEHKHPIYFNVQKDSELKCLFFTITGKGKTSEIISSRKNRISSLINFLRNWNFEPDYVSFYLQCDCGEELLKFIKNKENEIYIWFFSTNVIKRKQLTEAIISKEDGFRLVDVLNKEIKEF